MADIRKQDQLSALIRSLTKQEKRYFKLYASLQSGDKKFVQLFDELAKSEVYEPAILSKKLAIPKPLLGHTKDYLQLTLLASLRLYGQNTDVKTLLNNQWQEARLLYARAQHGLASSIIEKGLHTARLYDDFTMLYNFLLLKYAIIKFSEDKEEIRETKRLMSLVPEQILEVQQLIDINVSFSDHAVARKVKSPLTDIERKELFKILPAKLKSDSARIMWHEMKQNYCRYILDSPQAAIPHNVAKLKIFDSRPPLVYTWPNAYIIAMGYLCSHNEDLGRYKEAFKYSEMMERETSGYRKDIPASMCRDFNPVARLEQVILLCYMEKYTEAAAKAKELLPDKDKLRLVYLISMQHHYALALFHTQKYDEALEVCRQMQDLNAEVMGGMQFCNRLLLVMTHYALNNHTLVPYLVNSAVVWAKKHKVDFHATDEVLHWMRKLEKQPPSGKKKEYFTQLQKAIDAGELNPYDRLLGLREWVRRNS